MSLIASAMKNMMHKIRARAQIWRQVLNFRQRPCACMHSDATWLFACKLHKETVDQRSDNIMRFTPVFPLQRPISYLPQSKFAQVGKWEKRWKVCERKLIRAKPLIIIGRRPDEEAISCTHYDDVQLPLWEKLAEERIRMNQAKRKFSSKRNLSGSSIKIMRHVQLWY